MPPQSIKITLYLKIVLRGNLPKWWRTPIMIAVRRYHQVSMSSQDHPSSEIYYKPCLIIIGNYFALKINSKCLSKKLSKEVYPFLRCYHPKRRSWVRKRRKWQINTVGLYLLIPQLETKEWAILTVSCNSNLKYWVTRRRTVTSTKPWWFLVQKYSRTLLIAKTFLSSRKKSTDFSAQMPSIFHQELSLMRRGRRNIHSYKRMLQIVTPKNT